MISMERLSNMIDYLVDNRGKNPPYYTEGGIPVIDTFLIGNSIYPNVNNVTRYIDEHLYNDFIRSKNKKDDLLVTLVGNGYGNSCLCGDNEIIIQNAVGLRFKKNVSQIYIYYYFKQKDIIQWIQNLDRWSAQPNIKVSDLKRMKIELPNYIIQSKIATILNNYDQLIENNNNCIKLLEDMTESIYKEWFVRFRFPGYEKIETKLQSAKGWTFGNREARQSIPKDWNFKELIKIAEFKRGKNITSSEMVEGSIPVIAAGLEPSGYHNKSNVKGYNLTVSASGANAGYMTYHLEDIWAADCSYYQNSDNLWFVYNALKFLQPVISNMQIGSAQPHVYAKNINRLSTIIPSDELIKKFVDKVTPIYEEIKILKEKNKLLTKQRDSLLPRLMSGKLEVKC